MTKKIPCTKCGAMILDSTAQRTGGICMPCKNGFRTKEPKTEVGKFARRIYNKVVGFAVLIALLLGVLVLNFVNLPPSQRTSLIVRASVGQDFYFDESFDFIEGNNRLIISIRSGKLDYIVFATSESNGYPRYVGGPVRENQAVGHIFSSVDADAIEVTHSRKAFELTDSGVKEVPMNLRISPFEVPKLTKLLGTEFTIDKLIRIRNKI